jgi:hypothetical protein
MFNIAKKKFKIQGQSETCRSNGQVQDLASLKTAVFNTFSAYDWDRENFECAIPKRR